MSRSKTGKDDTDARPLGSSSHCTDSEPIPGTVARGSEQTNQNQNSGTVLHVPRKYIDAKEYIMDHEKRGKALIINNTKFEGDLGDRTGSDVDATAMNVKFQQLGFRDNDIEIKNDLSAEQIIQKLKEVADEDHSNADCFACVLLTHGDAQGLFGTEGKLTESDIMDCLNSKNCPTLAFKPKIFIFQACRGTKIDKGTKFQTCNDGNVMDAAAEPEEYLASQQTVKIPNDMNFLVCYASSDGKYANRHTEKGSVYIQKLSQEIGEMKEDEDFLTVLTRVNAKVALEFEHGGNDPMFQGMKQMPCFISRLTKPLRFRHK